MLDFFHDPGEIARCDQGVLDPNCHADTQKFHAGIGSLDLLRALRVSRQKRRPLALNVQLPSRLKPAFCSPREIACEHSGIEQYLQRLERKSTSSAATWEQSSGSSSFIWAAPPPPSFICSD